MFDHRRFIPAMDHAFRKSKTLFLKGRVEMRGPPEKLTGQQILLQIYRLGLMKVIELGSEKHNEKIISDTTTQQANKYSPANTMRSNVKYRRIIHCKT